MTSVYLDASVLVPIFVEEPGSTRAEAFVGRAGQVLIVSDFAAAEFASAIARRRRMREVDLPSASAIFAAFDDWSASSLRRIETTSGDISIAERMLRRLDLAIRTPDALNIAIAQRAEATLVTLDQKLAHNARTLGADVELL